MKPGEDKMLNTLIMKYMYDSNFSEAYILIVKKNIIFNWEKKKLQPNFFIGLYNDTSIPLNLFQSHFDVIQGQNKSLFSENFRYISI